MSFWRQQWESDYEQLHPVNKEIKTSVCDPIKGLLTEMYKDVPASESEPQIYQIVYSTVENLEWAANGYGYFHDCALYMFQLQKDL